MKEKREQIYLLAAIETLINNNSSTDLGDYTLEYGLRIGYVDRLLIEEEDASLDIMVRSRNNATGALEEGDLFHKIINKGGMINWSDEEEALNSILSMDTKEKLDFIMRKEKRFSKSKFTDAVTSTPSEFFQEAGIEDTDSYDATVTHFGIKLPDEVQASVTARVKEYIDEINMTVNETKGKAV